MYPTLMGTFNLPPSNLGDNASPIHVISPIYIIATNKVSQFRTSYFEEPWVIIEPPQGTGYKKTRSFMSTTYKKNLSS